MINIVVNHNIGSSVWRNVMTFIGPVPSVPSSANQRRSGADGGMSGG